MGRFSIAVFVVAFLAAPAYAQEPEPDAPEQPSTMPSEPEPDVDAEQAALAAEREALAKQRDALDARAALLDERQEEQTKREAALVEKKVGEEEEDEDEKTRSKHRVKSMIEVGFLDVLSHKVQFGEDGTYFDYVDEGGQDVWFFFTRLGLDWSPKPRHTILFLYQPLKIEGRTVLERDVQVQDLVFPAGSTLNTTYGFPFYRTSYMYDVARAEDLEISLGASLQIRNATIIFESGDGTQRRAQRNVGPVPILKARVRKELPQDYFVGLEADGFYAPISIINGNDSEVVGAIADVSLRVGRSFAEDKLDMYFNARYLGGGAVGSGNDNISEFDDGYVKNWLHFATISLGVDFDWTNGFDD